MTTIWNVAALAGAALAALGAHAQSIDYPEKPIRLIVGFAPGGAADILGRITGQLLTDTLGQQVIVDNRAGAGGLIATEIAARATPDGYTLLFTSPPHAINRSLYRKARYDPVADFAPAVHVVSTAMVLAVNPSTPFASVKEMIAHAKANPGKLTYGSGGQGASGHLAMELLKSVAAVDILHVPYKGTGPVLTDLIAGQIDMTIGSAAPTIPQVRSGKLRALAVTGTKRSPALPDVPTVAEGGFPAYEVTQWFGVLAPAGTPPAVVAKINAGLNRALAGEQARKLFLSRSVEPVGGSSEAFSALVRQEVAKWGKLVRALKLAI